MEEYRLRFTGARFDEPGFPLECIPELKTFQTLIVQASKEMYRENADLENLTIPDFSEVLELRLTSLEKGSVIPVLSMRGEAVLPGLPTRLEETLDWLENAMAGLLGEPKSVAKFSRAFVSNVLKFGVTLQESEAIELGMESSKNITWTKADALRIADARAAVNSTDLHLTLLGSISMLDRRKKFKLSTINHGLASGEFDTDDLYENFWDVLSSAKADKAVWVDCKVSQAGTNGEKLKITEVFQIGELGPIEDQATQLLDNLITEAVFLHAVPVFPSPDATFGAFEFLSKIRGNGIRKPVTFLDEEGGFNFDWSSEHELLSLLVENDGNFVGYFKNFSTGLELQAESLAGPSLAIEFIRGIDSGELILET